jgi:hypothetical protein
VTDRTAIRLTESSIGPTDVQVSVADVDHQAIVPSVTTLSIPEGMPRTFTVALAFMPTATTTVSIASTDQTAYPVSPTSIDFTPGNYANPITVTVTPKVDSNDVSETTTISMTATGIPTAAVAVTVADSTIVQNWGFPTPFMGGFQVPASFVYAYKIDVGAVANLNTFHAFLPAGAGTFTMALYNDAGGVPGLIVPNGAMLGPKVLRGGTNDSDALAITPQLSAPAYWLAIRFSQMNTISYAAPQVGFPGQMGAQCLRDVNVDIASPWPSAFGSASCTSDYVFNLWITTFHQ